MLSTRYCNNYYNSIGISSLQDGYYVYGTKVGSINPGGYTNTDREPIREFI